MLILEDNNLLMAKSRLSKEEIQLRKEIGSRLRILLKDKNIKGKNLAAGLGKTGSWLSYVLKGERKLSILEIMKITKYLNVSLSEIIPEIEMLITPQSLDETIEKRIMDLFEKHKKTKKGKGI